MSEDLRKTQPWPEPEGGTPREPDRFDKQAREIWDTMRFKSGGVVGLLAAALRAEHASALERAAQAVDLCCNRCGERIRALIPPAAANAAHEPERYFPGAAELMGEPPAPATETGRAAPSDEFYDALADGDWPRVVAEMEKVATPAPAQGADEIGYCKTCGLDASHGVCNDPRDKRIAELEAALRRAHGEGCICVSCEKMQARAAPPEGKGK